MTAGQPTKYQDEVTILATREYIESGYNEVGDMIPSIEGLSEVLDVCVKTLYNWRDAHGEFLQILDQLLAKQRRELINKGLSGDFNSNITKLVLGKHGYHDKQDNTHGGPDGGPLQVERIERSIIDP